jgi:CTD small phosphatase-like protein 2
LGRDLAKVVLIDNAAYSYAFQVSNGIPILPYYEGEADNELKDLKDYLFSLKGCKDVRVPNEEFFKLSRYNGFTDV